MHGEDWNGIDDMTGWWMSEKMDGIRGYWNGEKLLSRHGKEISCPKWFTEKLPIGIKLDGELWMGRGKFNELMAILNSNESETSELWGKQIKYFLFDILDSELTYERRMDELKKLNLPSFVSIVEVEKCRGNDHLYNKLRSIVKNNGEGLMLVKPNSNYVSERTKSLLKVKVQYFYF